MLNHGYYSAAAVIAGVVLETTLREMCANNDIEYGKMDKMNADLAKAGQYNKLTQKQITAIADIRNSAAHGEKDKFNSDDVKRMISYVENFVAEQI